MHLRRRIGFTLVELLIVVIIIAVLAAVAIPKFANSGQRAREAALRRQLRVARDAVERFYADTGHFPQRMSWLNDLESEVTPTFPALTKAGVQVNLPAAVYRGPYLPDLDGNGSFTSQPNPLGGNYTHSALRILKDPISGLPFKCRLQSGVFTVNSSATGNDSQGIPFSSY